ncbi:hypothetical protein B0H14DRAFT_2624599 [Mycena olivaceomarginata]|nr:hypothetical protein B0H14DRAFT_2624599 [Mycena olivaceomarginata]
MTLWVLPALPPNIAGCSHAFELMLGAPSIFNWNVGCSRPKIVGRSQVCELSMGAPIAPTEGSWEHPASSTGSIQGITQRLLGASRHVTWAVPSPLQNILGGSQDYYKGAPMAVRRELPCTLGNPGGVLPCRSVMNPVEAGSAFCAPVEGGCRSAVS